MINHDGVAELKYEFGCRDVAVLRLYKDFGIMQNPTSYMESATPLRQNAYEHPNIKRLKGECISLSVWCV
ncbi:MULTISPECIES: hypothetical protein [unclassified Nostoc]|uniref:hypothetical protein n=1 Tax=unclassified Nostoc TaxID=2593658 RepID=UPI002AD270C4|nr:hypothetical protein [Nostoc sp. DedQUE03]MDZ7971667.1 hypothetical protein [Nostoc sp. DedQUE03]MDZ8045208.1 hypothetical protein [Nostoc sp. DedQUE02]